MIETTYLLISIALIISTIWFAWLWEQAKSSIPEGASQNFKTTWKRKIFGVLALVSLFSLLVMATG